MAAGATSSMLSLCGRSTDLTMWMSHLSQVHGTESGLSLFCPLKDCNAEYSKVNSLYSHIYRRHKDTMKSRLDDCSHPDISITTVPSLDCEPRELPLNFSIPDAVQHDCYQLLCKDIQEQKKKSCLFLMQLKENRMVTQATVNDVVSGFKEVFKRTVSHIKAAVSEKLARSGSNMENINGLNSVFEEISDPFLGLETPYLQDKFISQELHCVVSISL